MIKHSKKNNKIISPQKWRHIYPIKRSFLHWGSSGIKVLNHFLILRHQIQNFKRWMFWHYKSTFFHFRKKKCRRRQYYWFHIRRCMPCSHKSKKFRMGKGRGKIVGWFGRLNAGNILVEFNFTKFNVVRDTWKYLTKKYSMPLHCVIRHNARSYLNLMSKYKYQPFFQKVTIWSYKRKLFRIRGYYLRRHEFII